jgi:CRP-like cAMP-binding protein
MSVSGIFPSRDFIFETGRLLEGLTHQESDILFRNKEQQSFKKGEIIFKDGNYAFGIYLVQSGLVKKYKVDGLGVEQIFYLYGKGEIFGYHALLNSRNHIDSTAAICDTQLYFIPGTDFLALLSVSPSFTRKLLSVLSNEFDVLSNIFTLYNQRSLRERLILMLVNLREKFKSPDFKEGDPVKIHVSRMDIASMLGTARESVVRIMRELKDEGLLVTKGAMIEIPDVKKLLGTVVY